MTTATQTVSSFKAPRFVESEMLKKVDKLNRRLARINVAPIQTTIADADTRYIYGNGYHTTAPSNPRQTFEVMEMMEVTFAYEALHKVGNWIVCAILEPIPGSSEALFRTIPGAPDVPESYRSRLGECDHCKKIRARKQTYIVQNADTLEFALVGSTCLKDHVGHSIESLLVMWDILNSADEFSSSDYGGRGVLSTNLQVYLAQVAACIQVDSWNPRSSGSGWATCDKAWSILTNEKPYKMPQGEWDEIREERIVTDLEMDLAAKAIEVVKSSESETTLDMNLKAICSSEYVSRKHVGYAALAIKSYLKAEASRKEAKTKKNEYYPGSEIKKRMLFENILVKRIVLSENEWGTTRIHLMEDAEGRTLVWFASSNSLSEGETYTFKATVTKRDVRDGICQTIVNRVTVE